MNTIAFINEQTVIKKYFLCLSAIFLLAISHLHAQAPQVTVVFVIDQGSYQVIKKLKPDMRYGMKTLLDNGVDFTQANHPHGAPVTSTGHTAIATGCPAQLHGIVSNSWYDQKGKILKSNEDSPEQYAVFSPTGVYPKGKSAQNIMVDTLSDQLMLASRPGHVNQSVAVSYKSRASIPMAGKMGGAIWFDDETGIFTTSKAYYNAIPNWVVGFNERKHLNTLKGVRWPRFYRSNTPYQFKDIDNYTYTSKPSIVNTFIKAHHGTQEPFKEILKTPYANLLLLELALSAFDVHYTGKSPDKLILWVGLSSLDKTGHTYGPQSMEYIDMLYHLDYQLGQFMRTLAKRVPSERTLYVLTADHGVCPIPENMRDLGYFSALRNNYPTLVNELNTLAADRFGLRNVVATYQPTGFYLRNDILSTLTAEQQHELLIVLKEYLMQKPGIKIVWTAAELHALDCELPSLEAYFKKQFYPGRSGQLIVMPDPYCPLTDEIKGGDHRTPYAYDTQVPLVLYRKGILPAVQIHEQVWTWQLANTLAQLLEIPRPSASVMPPLPIPVKQP